MVPQDCDRVKRPVPGVSLDQIQGFLAGMSWLDGGSQTVRDALDGRRITVIPRHIIKMVCRLQQSVEGSDLFAEVRVHRLPVIVTVRAVILSPGHVPVPLLSLPLLLVTPPPWCRVPVPAAGAWAGLPVRLVAVPRWTEAPAAACGAAPGHGSVASPPVLRWRTPVVRHVSAGGAFTVRRLPSALSAPAVLDGGPSIIWIPELDHHEGRHREGRTREHILDRRLWPVVVSRKSTALTLVVDFTLMDGLFLMDLREQIEPPCPGFRGATQVLGNQFLHLRGERAHWRRPV
ncbi:uncharacterized protein V3H82_013548 isoform 2-T19 [Fundulus diaphanus]